MDESDIRLPVPIRFRRGSLREDPVKSLQSGLDLLDWVARIRPIEGARILDFGCGVKIAQALVQRGSPQALYAGLDVYAGMIDFLRGALGEDPKYAIHRVPFRNEMYNPGGEPMRADSVLPLGEARFDLLFLFSVITHMTPADSDAVLRILRRYALPDARLVFWAFADPDQTEDFVDGIPDRPLLHALYRRPFLEEIVAGAGWTIRRAMATDTRKHRKVRYVCLPAG
jgi:SAM-dependent methyltransferase